MNISEIEKLHAQYAPHPVVIDLTGQVAAMPALAAPENHGETVRWSLKAFGRRHGKPLGIVVAAAVIALGGGMSAARLWQVVRHPLVTSAAPTVGQLPAARPTPAPIDAMPGRPLSASDFAVDDNPHVGMGSVDPHELLRQTARPAESGHPVEPTNGQGTSDEARAIVSPIHAPHREPLQPVQSVPAPPAPQPAPAEPKPQPVATPVPLQRVQPETASAAAAPTVHHVRHTTVRAVAASAAKPDEPTQSTQAAPEKPAAPARSGDVPLF